MRNYDGVYFFDPNVNFSKFTYPGVADFGNAGRNTFRGPRFFNVDASLVKSFAITERRRMSSAPKPTTCSTMSISATPASAYQTLTASARSATSSTIRASCRAPCASIFNSPEGQAHILPLHLCSPRFSAES